MTCFDSLREKVKNKFNFFDNVEFTHFFLDKDYGLLARHGHEWDNVNHGWEFYNYIQDNNSKSINRFDFQAYQVQTLGEVVTCELMSGLVYYIKKAVKKDINDKFIKEIMNINNIRPMTDVFSWLAWNHRNYNDKTKKIIIEALIKALNGLLDSSLVKKWDNMKTDWLFSSDLIDKLQKLKLALTVLNYDSFDKLIDVIVRIFGEILESNDELLEGAKKEFENKSFNNNIRYILYGHTHWSYELTLSANKNDYAKIYLNTGTYLPLIQKTDNKKDFVSLKRMTIANIYKSDEINSKVPVLDYWNGLRT